MDYFFWDEIFGHRHAPTPTEPPPVRQSPPAEERIEVVPVVIAWAGPGRPGPFR